MDFKRPRINRVRQVEEVWLQSLQIGIFTGSRAAAAEKQFMLMDVPWGETIRGKKIWNRQWGKNL